MAINHNRKLSLTKRSRFHGHTHGTAAPSSSTGFSIVRFSRIVLFTEAHTAVASIGPFCQAHTGRDPVQPLPDQLIFTFNPSPCRLFDFDDFREGSMTGGMHNGDIPPVFLLPFIRYTAYQLPDSTMHPSSPEICSSHRLRGKA